MKDFLVGVLYSGENEYNDCLMSIKEQMCVSFDVFTISFESKSNAHTQLYSKFMNSANEFKYFIKIDADMIIKDSKLLLKLSDLFNKNLDKDLIQFTLFDFFTNQYIWGIHCYRNTVVWPKKNNYVFTDTTPVPSEKRIYENNQFKNSVLHCPNPNKFQCFHYGIHRGAKIIQRNILQKKKGASRTHWEHYLKLTYNYKNTKDIRLAYAIFGFECIFGCILDDSNLNYSDKKSKIFFDFINKRNIFFFYLLFYALRLYNFSIFSSNRRYKLLLKFRRTGK